MDFAGMLFERQRAALALLLLGAGTPETVRGEDSARDALEAMGRRPAGQNARNRSVRETLGHGTSWESGTGFQDALERTVTADRPSGTVETFGRFDDARAAGEPSWNGFPLPKYGWALDREYTPQYASDGAGMRGDAEGFQRTADGGGYAPGSVPPASEMASVRLEMLRPGNGDVPANSGAVWMETPAVQRDSSAEQARTPDTQRDSGAAEAHVETAQRWDPANMDSQTFRADSLSALRGGDASSDGLLPGFPAAAAPVQNQARALSAAFQRDARRYDGGFPLF